MRRNPGKEKLPLPLRLGKLRHQSVCAGSMKFVRNLILHRSILGHLQRHGPLAGQSPGWPPKARIRERRQEAGSDRARLLAARRRRLSPSLKGMIPLVVPISRAIRSRRPIASSIISISARAVCCLPTPPWSVSRKETHRMRHGHASP